MTRIFEIYDDNKERVELSSDKLPLEVFLLKDKENSLVIATINQEADDDKNVCGYIEQEDEHLYFQPEERNLTNTIFHNDEIITKSVWLKSGDVIQFQEKIISYTVSGDRVKIIVSNRPEIPVIVPPTDNKIVRDNQKQTNKSVQSQSEEKHTHVENNISKKQKIKNKLIVLLLFIVSLIAIFILFAETTVINIKPKADNISLKGFFPTIKFDERFILLSGKYILEAEKKGYRAIIETLNITSSNNNFSFLMKENPGLIQFNVNPDTNNKIYIDEVLLGQSNNDSSLLQYEVERGEHNLRVVNPRYKEYVQKIKVEGKNIKQEYKINLQANWGILRIRTSQKDINIVIYIEDNEEKEVYGYTINDMAEIELIAGQYTLYATKEKYKTKTNSLNIKAGEKLDINPFELEPEDGILNLTSIPTESIIRVDGHYLGKTPQILKLSPDIEHTLELSLTGFKTLKKVIKLESEVVLEEAIKLKVNTGLIFIAVAPKNASLYIDGIKQKENSGKFTLTKNNHLLTVKAKGYQEQSKRINIGNYSKNISFVLKKTNGDRKPGKSNKIKNKNYKNIINQKMILVKPESFVMGSKKSEAGRSSNEREHKIKITYNYYLSEKEISNKQYRKFKRTHNSGISNNKSLNRDDQPAVNVSWQDAARFTNWLSKKESLEPYYKEENGKMVPVNITREINGYRLPFEAEWVLAARGNQQKKYPWYGSYPPTSISGNFADDSASKQVSNTIAGYNDKQSVSAPIGSYEKNKMGFYDLGGNVSEWCQDFYSPSSGLSGNTINVNPSGPVKGTHKVVRDSSWRDSSITELRLSYRSYSKKKANDIGFRIARYAK